jgi:hypothetical protein
VPLLAVPPAPITVPAAQGPRALAPLRAPQGLQWCSQAARLLPLSLVPPTSGETKDTTDTPNARASSASVVLRRMWLRRTRRASEYRQTLLRDSVLDCSNRVPTVYDGTDNAH